MFTVGCEKDDTDVYSHARIEAFEELSLATALGERFIVHAILNHALLSSRTRHYCYHTIVWLDSLDAASKIKQKKYQSTFICRKREKQFTERSHRKKDERLFYLAKK